MSNEQPAPHQPRRGLVGRVLGGRYRVTRLVSAGASALIADAEDTELARPVTVKLVRPEFAESIEFRNRFRTTMRSVTGLAHPNVAAVYDWGEELIGERTTVYAVVEYLGGGSLRDLFDRGRYLDPSQALLVGLEACRGLDFAHRKGLVHTELTPSKLVFGDDRRLRIVDFGLAALLGEIPWTEPATLPTHVARYCSPEQALSQPLDGKTDVYALTLVLAEAVSGRVPFAARSTVATLSARIGRLMPVSADLGPLASVLERAGRPESADRSTAAELGRALVRIAEKLPRPAPIPIMVTTSSAGDPNRMRRPDDPTGGLTRPTASDVAEAAAPAAPMVVDGEPGDDDDGGPDGDASAPPPPESPPPMEPPPPIEPPASSSPPPPSTPPSSTSSTLLPAPPPALPMQLGGIGAADRRPTRARLYDGDGDVTKDELAALASSVPGEVARGGAAMASGNTLQALRPPMSWADEPSGWDEEQAGSDSPDLQPASTTTTTTMTAGKDTDPWSARIDTADAGPRRRWLVALAALVALAMLGGLAVLASMLFRGPATHEVPELVGLDLAVATERITAFDWQLDVRRERSDEQPVVGLVVRTEPAAGADLAEEAPFLVVVSDGPQLRTLPEIRGLPIGDAETALAEQRLVALAPTEEFDEDAPPGAVLSWSVPADVTLAAGGQVLPETEVAVVVSAGPAPRTVPDVVGDDVDDATEALRELQLDVDLAEAIFDDDVPEGAVISATPVAGQIVERGATVRLLPSKGQDLVAVPDLSGLTLPQAREALAAAGLQIGAITGNSLGTFSEASVGGSAVEGGDEFVRNMAIDVVFL